MTLPPRILFSLPDDNRRSLQRYLAIVHQLAQGLPNVQQKLLVKTRPEFVLPPGVKVSWQLNGIYKLLDEVYDRILFYGQRDLLDPVIAYQMSASTAVNVVECGDSNDLNSGSNGVMIARNRTEDKISILVVVDSEEAIENCTQFFNRHKVENNTHLPVHLSLLIDSKLTIQQIRDFLTTMEQWPIDVVNFDLSLCHKYIDSADLVVCDASYASVCNVLGHNKQTLYLLGKKMPPDILLRAQNDEFPPLLVITLAPDDD
jgi:predicted glycosyltransferase